MTTTSIPMTTQQLKEIPLVKIDTEDVEFSPIHGISLGNDEQHVEMSHLVMSSINEFADQSYPYESKQKNSFTGDSSPVRSNEENRLTLKQILKDKITELKTELRELYSKELDMKEEIKSLKNELFLWISKWKEMKMKKDRQKATKKSMTIMNQRLLEKTEHQKLKILKLKARLSEARRATKFQVSS